MASYTPLTYFQGIIYNPIILAKLEFKEIQEIQFPSDLKVFKVFKGQQDIRDQREFKDPREMGRTFPVEINMPTPLIGIAIRVVMK